MNWVTLSSDEEDEDDAHYRQFRISPNVQAIVTNTNIRLRSRLDCTAFHPLHWCKELGEYVDISREHFIRILCHWAPICRALNRGERYDVVCGFARQRRRGELSASAGDSPNGRGVVFVNYWRCCNQSQCTCEPQNAVAFLTQEECDRLTTLIRPMMRILDPDHSFSRL